MTNYNMAAVPSSTHELLQYLRTIYKYARYKRLPSALKSLNFLSPINIKIKFVVNNINFLILKVNL